MEEDRGIKRGGDSGKGGEFLMPGVPLTRPLLATGTCQRRQSHSQARSLLTLSPQRPLLASLARQFPPLNPGFRGSAYVSSTSRISFMSFSFLFSDSHSSLPRPPPPHTFFLTLQTSLQHQVRNSFL